MYSTCPHTRRIGIRMKRCGTTSSTKNSRGTRPRPRRRSRSWPNVSSPTCLRTPNCYGESTSGAVLQIYCLEPYLDLRDALKSDGIEVELFHARFPFGQRQTIEDAVLCRFGREGGPTERHKRVLVATQVV